MRPSPWAGVRHSVVPESARVGLDNGVVATGECAGMLQIAYAFEQATGFGRRRTRVVE